MDNAQMIRSKWILRSNHAHLRQSEIAISDHLVERIVVSLTPHQERQKSIMAAIQFDSLTGNLC